MKMEKGITYGNQMMEKPSYISPVKHSTTCSPNESVFNSVRHRNTGPLVSWYRFYCMGY